MAESKRNKKEPAHHAVAKLLVVGGFLGGVELEFTDGLNCLIVGRGAGKTTAFEFLRFGLGLMPDPKISAQRPLLGLIENDDVRTVRDAA